VSNRFKSWASLIRRRAGFFGLLVIVLALFTLLSVAALENYRLFFGMYHDDSVYMVSAKSLAEGHGYRIASLPGDPVQSKYPVGFPLMLSVLWKVFPSFPENLVPMEIVQIIIGAAACIVSTFYLIRTRKITWLMGGVIIAACLFNQRYVDVAPMLLSDFLCALLAAVALWKTETLYKRGNKWISWAVLGVLWSLPLFVRVQGLVAAAACFLFLLAHKRYKGALIAGAIAGAIVIPELIWQGYNAAKSPAFIGYYTGYLPSDGRADVSLIKFWKLISTSHEWGGFIQIGTYFPFFFKIPFWALSPALYFAIYRFGYWALGSPLILGALRELKRLRLPGIYCLLYSLPLLVMPVRIEFRQILPVLPFTYYFYLQGCRVIGRWLKPQDIFLRGIYVHICAALFMLFSTYLTAGGIIESLQRTDLYETALHKSAIRFSPQAGNTDYAEAFYWVSNSTKPSDVFLCNSDPLFYLYTGRKAMQPWKVDLFSIVREGQPPPEAMLESIKFSGANYIIVDPLYRGLGKELNPADFLVLCLSYKYPGSMKEVFHSSHNLIRIYEIQQPVVRDAMGVH
jgi:hypothetical protein